MLFVGSSALGAPRSRGALEKQSSRASGSGPSHGTIRFAAFAALATFALKKNSGTSKPRRIPDVQEWLIVAWTPQDSGDANRANTCESNRAAFRAPHRQDERSCPLWAPLHSERRAQRSPRKKDPRGPAVVACPQGTIRFVRIRGIRVQRILGRPSRDEFRTVHAMVARGLEAPGFWRRESREHVRIQPSAIPLSSPVGRALMLFVGSSALGAPRSRGAVEKHSPEDCGSSLSRGTIRFVCIRDIRVQRILGRPRRENVMPAREHEASRRH